MTIFHTDFVRKQFSSHLFRRRQELVRHQRHPTDRWPSLFAEFHFWGLLIVLKGKVTAGWPLICPGEPQEDLVRGQLNYYRRDVCRRVPFLVWVAQNVRTYQCWPCREKLRNKVCSTSLVTCFINTFPVDFSHISFSPPACLTSAPASYGVQSLVAKGPQSSWRWWLWFCRPGKSLFTAIFLHSLPGDLKYLVVIQLQQLEAMHCHKTIFCVWLFIECPNNVHTMMYEYFRLKWLSECPNNIHMQCNVRIHSDKNIHTLFY